MAKLQMKNQNSFPGKMLIFVAAKD